jgi:phage terminase Nu1 subunit (DNA packaging protein)
MADKWTINRLADETGYDRRTLKKILATTDPCDANETSDLYWLSDFCRALVGYNAPEQSTGDLEAEQTRLTSVKADIAEVERARLRNEVIETQTVFNVWENVGASIRRTILTSPLPPEQKDAILNELRSLKIEDFLEQREFDQGTPAEIS